MGGGSSNDQKVKQINQNMNQQLVQSFIQKNKDLKNNSKINSPSNSKKKSPRFNENSQSMQKYVQNDKVRKNNSKISKVSLKSQQRQMNNNSKAKSNYLNNNESKLSKMSQIKKIRKQKIGTQWIPEKSQQQINLQLIQFFPNNYQRKKIQQFTYLRQKQNKYKALFQWQRDKNQQIWRFNIYQNDQLNLSLEVDSQNQLINGDGDKWLLVSPIKQNGQIKKYKQYFITQTIFEVYDIINDNKMIDKSPFIKQFEDLQQNKQTIFQKWGQQYIQSKIQFSYRPKAGLNQLNGHIKFKNAQNYYRLTKYYLSDSNQWLLSSFILQQQNTFKAWLIWKQLQEQERLNEQIIKQYQQLIQKQQKIINLKKDVYLCRIKSYLISNQNNQYDDQKNI